MEFSGLESKYPDLLRHYLLPGQFRVSFLRRRKLMINERMLDEALDGPNGMADVTRIEFEV